MAPHGRGSGRRPAPRRGSRGDVVGGRPADAPPVDVDVCRRRHRPPPRRDDRRRPAAVRTGGVAACRRGPQGAAGPGPALRRVAHDRPGSSGGRHDPARRSCAGGTSRGCRGRPARRHGRHRRGAGARASGDGAVLRRPPGRCRPPRRPERPARGVQVDGPEPGAFLLLSHADPDRGGRGGGRAGVATFAAGADRDDPLYRRRPRPRPEARRRRSRRRARRSRDGDGPGDDGIGASGRTAVRDRRLVRVGDGSRRTGGAGASPR